MIMGIDLASGPDRTVVTATNQPFKWKKVGDRVRISGCPNSIRHRIAQKINANQVELTAYRRPSKGYRKHVRRMKQERR